MTTPNPQDTRSALKGTDNGALPSARAATASPPSPSVSGQAGIANAEEIAREAFKAGWKERDRNPGLKRVLRRSLDNAIRSAIGGGRFNDYDLVPDHRKYHTSIWLNSAFRRTLAEAIEARRAETGTGSVHESVVTEGHSPEPSRTPSQGKR